MSLDSQVPSSQPSDPSQPGQDQHSDQISQHHHFLDALPVVVWQGDRYGRIHFLSARWQTLTGQSPQENLGEAFWDVVVEQGRVQRRQQWQLACQQRQPFTLHLDLMQANGIANPVRVMGEPAHDDQGQLLGWMGTMQSTEIVSSLQFEVDYNQLFLATVLDNLSNGIVACDSQGVLMQANLAVQKILQKPFRRVPADQWADYFSFHHTDGVTQLAQAENPLYRALHGASVRAVEMVIKPQEGALHTVLASGEPIMSQDGQTLGAVVILQDITDLRQAERELQNSEARWQLALQGAGDGIFDWNLITNEAFLSLPWKQTLGYEEHEVENTFEGWRSLVHPEDLEKAGAALEAHFQQNMPLYTAEFRMRCKDGDYKWILARGQTQRDEDGHPIRMLGLHQDITPQKRAESRLAQLNHELQSCVQARDSQLAVADRQNGGFAVQPQLTSQQASAEIELHARICTNMQLGFLAWSAVDLMPDALQLVTANAVAESLLEMALSDHIGCQIRTFFPGLIFEYPHSLSTLINVIQDQKPSVLKHVVCTLSTGQERHFSWKMFPLPDLCLGIAFESRADPEHYGNHLPRL